MRIVLPELDDPKAAAELEAYHQELEDKLRQRLELAAAGGGAHRIAIQHQRGKLTARQRIAYLQDQGSVFLELSALAGGEDGGPDVPSGGLVTGVLPVHGRLCMVVANDQTVKAGAYFPITVKKHLRAQEIAAQNRLPCVYLVDSAGAFLPRQAELFADQQHFGRIFYNQAHMSSQGIPQLAAVHGHCTAGGAYIPAMSDYTVMVKTHGRIFLGGPPLVKAATGEEVSSAELGGYQIHTQQSGLVDAVADTDEQALDKIRAALAGPFQRDDHRGWRTGSEPGDTIQPHYNITDVYRRMGKTYQQRLDPKVVLAAVVDGSEFAEFKPAYGPTLVTGWASIMGIPVGVLANYGVLHAASAQKATHFIDLCVAAGRPLVFVQNIPGFMVGQAAESSGIAKYGAMMVRAVAVAQVPKVTLIIGGSFGAGNYAMCGRAYGGDYVFTWPGARIGVMGAQQAWSVMQAIGPAAAAGEQPDGAAEFQARYERTTCPYYATAQLWDDGLIAPSTTRQVLAAALASTLTKVPPAYPTHKGIVRQ